MFWNNDCKTLKLFMQFFRDLSLPAIVAGFVVVLVGFTSTGAVVFQAAQNLGATQAQINSWMWALGIGMGLASVIPSLIYRTPVVSAWSTPGAALIATSVGISMPEAIGAFVICAVLTFLFGVTGLFEKLINRIPMAIAAAMLAGVLLRFGLDAFASIKAAPLLVLSMIAAHLIGRRWWPRYAVVGVLCVGTAIALFSGTLKWNDISVELTQPVWTTPAFSVAATVGLAIPLFIVSMASQNMPGVAVMRSSGYDTKVSPVITTLGAVNLPLAPFGAFSLTLAAITAAIAMTPEAHEDKSKRYTAAVMAGIFYIAIGLCGAIVGTLFAAFPKALVVTLAGLALIMTIGNGLVTAIKEEADREPAMITFLVTASGVTLAGIGSAFWGLVAGMIALLVLRVRMSNL
jgi:benzoate membrane transport protein